MKKILIIIISLLLGSLMGFILGSKTTQNNFKLFLNLSKSDLVNPGLILSDSYYHQYLYGQVQDVGEDSLRLRMKDEEVIIMLPRDKTNYFMYDEEGNTFLVSKDDVAAGDWVSVSKNFNGISGELLSTSIYINLAPPRLGGLLEKLAISKLLTAISPKRIVYLEIGASNNRLTNPSLSLII